MTLAVFSRAFFFLLTPHSRALKVLDKVQNGSGRLTMMGESARIDGRPLDTKTRGS